MQEKLGKSVLRSHWPQLPDPLPHTPCPLPSDVYPPRTRVPDTAVLWWSPTSRQPGEKAQGSSCGSGETCLHLLHPLQKLRWSFFPSLRPFCSGVCPTPLESLLLWVTSFTLTQGHHQPQHPSQTWEAPSASHSSHQQILSCTATLGDLDTELWSLTVASQLKPRFSLSHY